jgi:hypothetical protein
MAVRKARPAPTPSQREVDYRVAQARPPREDPTGTHTAAVAELARQHGRDVADLLELWSERAAIRQYLGEADRDEAERLAVEDVRWIVAIR